jgi:excinuclease ABC subunit C
VDHFLKNLMQQLDKVSLEGLASTPGVYRFYDVKHNLLYVGKARHLQKRVTSYFRGQKGMRIQSLVRQIAAIETTLTQTENEALLLESNLIKALKPRYNIILRDDKSYPWITLSEQAYPRLSFYRGKPRLTGNTKSTKTQYFGPYPSIKTARETLDLLQKLFQVRSCRDSFFQARTRPCLQYQMQRCSAPCVGHISPENYRASIQQVRLFLQGKDSSLIATLRARMEVASQSRDYETAVCLRDQIASLRQIQQQQVITTTTGDADVVEYAYQQDLHCVYVLQIREGRVISGQAYFPDTAVPLDPTLKPIQTLDINPSHSAAKTILTAFLPQFYLNNVSLVSPPSRIILAEPLPEQDWIASTLSMHTGQSIKIQTRPKGNRYQWLQLAKKNAEQALNQKLHSQATRRTQFQQLQQFLRLNDPPQRLTCFDVSHTQGEAPVASCVVMDIKGLRKQDYRYFHLKNIQPGDDYAAMRQALMRYYVSLIKKATEKKEIKTLRQPELLIVDGGKGQLTQARAVLEELKLMDSIQILAIAKGPTRKPGKESLFLAGKKQVHPLPSDHPVRHILQEIRDEAHRFAITAHRSKRAIRSKKSVLETIPGIGPKRRQALLTQFGGLQGLQAASVQTIIQLPNMSKKLAERVYQTLKSY